MFELDWLATGYIEDEHTARSLSLHDVTAEERTVGPVSR
jgi:hypothetical protein